MGGERVGVGYGGWVGKGWGGDRVVMGRGLVGDRLGEGWAGPFRGSGVGRILGKYQKPHIFDELLQDKKSLHFRWPRATVSPKWVSPSFPQISYRGAHTFSTNQ